MRYPTLGHFCMSNELETAARYRLYAEELRTVADAAAEPNDKRQLRAIATIYLQMADQLE